MTSNFQASPDLSVGECFQNDFDSSFSWHLPGFSIIFSKEKSHNLGGNSSKATTGRVGEWNWWLRGCTGFRWHLLGLHLSQLDAFASFATILQHSYPFLTSNLEQLHHHSLLITRRLLDTRHCCSRQRSAKGPRHHRLWCLAFSSVGWCRVSGAWMGMASWPYVYIIIKVFIKVDLKPQEHLTVLGRKPLFGDIWACLLQKCLGPVEFITKNVIVHVRQRLWNHTVFQNENEWFPWLRALSCSDTTLSIDLTNIICQILSRQP